MFIKIHKLRKDNSAQAAVFAALILLVLVMFVMLVVDVGQLITWRIRMQNATDSAAMAGAVWQARGLNVIAVLNIIWVPVFIFEVVQCFIAAAGSFGLALLAYPFPLTNTVQDIQDVMKYAIPVMAITQVATYGKANKADIAVPLPTAVAESLLSINSISDVKGIFDDAKSLTSWIPCWLNVERAHYFLCNRGWLGFMTGGEDVYTFSLAYKKPQPVLIGGSLLGIKNTPSIYTTAKAVPDGGCLGGELPGFSAAGDLIYTVITGLVGKVLKVLGYEKHEEETTEHLTKKLEFKMVPDPNYEAKFDKTGFERILMVH